MFRQKLLIILLIVAFLQAMLGWQTGSALAAPGVTAETIDNYLRGKGSPIAGQGTKFVSEGRIHGVDPRLIAAISGAESSFGKNLCASFNAWGYMYWPNGKRTCYPFQSWGQGIETVSWQIGSSSLYFKAGLKTIPDIGKRYCGTGCSVWVNNVTMFYRDMGGDMNDLTFKEVNEGVPPYDPAPPLIGVRIREQIYWDQIYTGSVDSLNQEQWKFFFSDTRNFKITLKRTSGSGEFSMQILQNEDGTGGIMGAGGIDEAISAGTLPAGTYYGLVEATSGSGSYTLTIQKQDAPPSTPPPTTGRIQFGSGLVSNLYFDNNGDRINLKVCASNTPGKTIYVIMQRPGREWRLPKPATGTCTLFEDMDGAGPVLNGATYTTWASLGDWPDTSWPIPCAGVSGGYGLCDRAVYGNPATAIPPTTPPTVPPATPAPTALPPTPQSGAANASTGGAIYRVGDELSFAINLVPPSSGALGAEFACTFDPALLEFQSAAAGGLFGQGLSPIINSDGIRRLTLAITGLNGYRATQSGKAFDLTFTALQPGAAMFTCTAEVSVNDDGATQNIVFTPATVTINPQPTQPPQSQSGAITGVVKRKGSNANTTITLLDAGGQAIAAAQTAADGAFTLGDVLAGVYTIRAEAPGYLAAQGTVTVTAGNNVAMPMINLTAGDLNGDSKIDVLDFVTLGGAYGKSSVKVTAADLNGDGAVDLSDLTIFATNYNKAGVEEWK